MLKFRVTTVKQKYLWYLILRRILLSSVSISNGVSRIEEDEDEDEQGEKFEFDDGIDIGPPQMSCGSLMKSEWTTDTSGLNLYVQTNKGQEAAGPDMTRTTSTVQKDQNSSLFRQHCSGEITGMYVFG